MVVDWIPGTLFWGFWKFHGEMGIVGKKNEVESFFIQLAIKSIFWLIPGTTQSITTYIIQLPKQLVLFLIVRC